MKKQRSKSRNDAAHAPTKLLECDVDLDCDFPALFGADADGVLDW